jgi:hypothetical protein
MNAAKPLLQAAESHFQKCVKEAKKTGHKDEEWMKDTKNAAIALTEAVFDKYDEDGIDIWNVIEPIEALVHFHM